MSRINRGFSIVYKYILSSFAIVLIACFLIGIILYFASVNELKKNHEATVMDKLSLAITDIENQHDILAEISYKLSSEIYYKKSYIERNAYYEIDLFEDFRKYKGNSQIIDDYFFIYHGEKWVYKTNNAKNTFDVFLSSYGIREDMTTLYLKLNDVDSFTIIPCRTILGDTHIFAWPVYTGGKGNEQGRALVGFFVSPETLQKRIINVTGGLTGYVYLYYKDTLISSFSSGNVTSKFDPDLGDKGERYQYTSQGGNFRIAVDIPESNIYSRLNVFSSINAIYLVIAAMLLIIFPIWVSYNNYKPIKKLREKYQDFYTSNEYKNELNFFDHVFNSVLEDKSKAENDIHRQYQMLRKQILQLVLNGDYRCQALVSKPFMGINLLGPLYGIMAVNFSMTVLDEAREEEISSFIEDLSNEELFLYFVSTKHQGFYAVIISAPDEESLMSALENVQTLLGEQEANTYGSASLCKDVKDFPDTLSMAIFNCRASSANSSSYYGDMIVNYDEEIMNLLLKAIRCQNVDAAYYYFNMLAEDIHKKASSFLLERYIFSNIFYRLSIFAGERNVTLSMDHINTILVASDIDDIYFTLKTIIQKLCNLNSSSQESAKNTKASSHFERIVEYIDANYANSEMTLDLLSEQFGLSGKYISSIIKDGKGKPYKDYLTSLRIQKAQELLMTGSYTVTEVCEKVGYTHLPLFIKTFKDITGHTPSRFIDKK